MNHPTDGSADELPSPEPEQPKVTQEAAVQQQQAPESWYQKNKFWTVILTYLSIMVLCSGCILVFYLGAYNTVRNSPPYKKAVILLKANEEAMELLGEPIVTDMLQKGAKFDYSEKKDEKGRIRYSGDAQFTIPIRGSKQDGRLFVKAIIENDKWTLKKVVFETDDTEEIPGKTIDLLDAEK